MGTGTDAAYTTPAKTEQEKAWTYSYNEDNERPITYKVDLRNRPYHTPEEKNAYFRGILDDISKDAAGKGDLESEVSIITAEDPDNALILLDKAKYLSNESRLEARRLDEKEDRVSYGTGWTVGLVTAAASYISITQGLEQSIDSWSHYVMPVIGAIQVGGSIAAGVVVGGISGLLAAAASYPKIGRQKNAEEKNEKKYGQLARVIQNSQKPQSESSLSSTEN